MGKASSAKKVARAARVGSASGPNERRQFGFSAVVIVLVVLVVALVGVAVGGGFCNDIGVVVGNVAVVAVVTAVGADVADAATAATAADLIVVAVADAVTVRVCA